MELVRSFVDQTPPRVPIFIAGRSHFFDSPDELMRALGIGSACGMFSLSEFTEEQVRAFLKSRGWEHNVPDWVPTRPLLLGYLAARGLLSELTQVATSVSEAVGWNELIDLVCEREAKIDPCMDGHTVRRLLERMATKARRHIDGMGPILQTEMTEVFEEVCGYVPDENGIQLLQRLPGLGVARQIDAAREFIDCDFVDALRSGDIARFCVNPFFESPHLHEEWNCSCASLGLDVIAHQTEKAGLGASELSIAAQAAVYSLNCPGIAGEIIAAMARRGLAYNQKPLVVRDVLMRDIEFDQTTTGLGNIEFVESIFGRLCLDPLADQSQLPKFRECHFELLETTLQPSGSMILLECSADTTVNSASTNNQILSLSVAEGTKVLLTVLRKLFLQPGAGRRENAFYRGLDQHMRLLVPDVLKLVSKHNMAHLSRLGQANVWVPNRSMTQRARRILASPSGKADLMVAESMEIN